MPQSFDAFLSSISGVLDLALTSSLDSRPVRPGDIAVGIAMEPDVLRACVQSGQGANFARYLEHRRGLDPQPDQNMLPGAIMDALHAVHERYADKLYVEQSELMRMGAYQVRFDPRLPEEGRERAQQAEFMEGVAAMGDGAEGELSIGYQPKARARVARLMDLLNRMCDIDADSVRLSLSALGAFGTDVQSALANIGYNNP